MAAEEIGDENKGNVLCQAGLVTSRSLLPSRSLDLGLLWTRVKSAPESFDSVIPIFDSALMKVTHSSGVTFLKNA